ncbi:MAG: hypothetical protein ACRD4L_10035 [Pyrinomonadaceae bacterium]
MCEIVFGDAGKSQFLSCMIGKIYIFTTYSASRLKDSLQPGTALTASPQLWHLFRIALSRNGFEII